MITIHQGRISQRILSEIFTPSGFRQIIGDNQGKVLRKITRHTDRTSNSTVYQSLKAIYNSLQASYRSEYFYKNVLLKEELLNRYHTSSTVVLNEFKIEKSKADFVLLNGEARIYEIKSDLDGLAKLPKQIEDYKKFAEKVFIVTCQKFLGRVLSDFENSSVGVILYTSDNQLQEIKKATKDCSRLDHRAIFRTLRKNEYMEIVSERFGICPDVPNTKIFSMCEELFSELDVQEFQKLAVTKLKKRKLKCADFLYSQSTPEELKYLCYINDLSEAEYLQLYDFLNLTH